jgi:hypothetical protein
MDWAFEEWAGAGQVFVEGVADLFSWALIAELGLLLGLALLFHQARRMRRFWCPLMRREVEVEFEQRGLPLARRLFVQRCSVFEPGAAVACGRRCVDGEFRRQRWDSPLRARTR